MGILVGDTLSFDNRSGVVECQGIRGDPDPAAWDGSPEASTPRAELAWWKNQCPFTITHMKGMKVHEGP
jgi:hypothetical protein